MRLLDRLQQKLARLYDLDASYDVRHFVITDRRLAAALEGVAGSAVVNEKLLVASDADGDTVSLSLFVDQQVLDRLDTIDPFDRLDDANLPDFLVALEGVSHFVYLAFNAAFERQVTQLEMELQAEVDKYVLVLMMLSHQHGTGVPARLHEWLFARPRLVDGLAAEHATRYRHANRYAARYCRRLENYFFGRFRRRGLMPELRRFYRLPQAAKLRHIETALA